MYLGIRLLCHYNFRWPICRWVWFIFVLLCFFLPSLYCTLVFRYNTCRCRKIQTEVNIMSWLEARKIYDSLEQGCTNPGWQVTVATKFCMVMPNICGEWLHVTFLVPRILRWFLRYLENLCTPALEDVHSAESIPLYSQGHKTQSH